MLISDIVINPTYRSYIFGTNNVGGLLVFEPVSSIDALTWGSNHKIFIEEALLKYGGVLLRNFQLRSISEFNQFAQMFRPNLLEYTYRSTPRENLGGKIYTSTEYPSELPIALHNENSYAKSWPKIIMFFCSIAPTLGGETPIADSREVFRKLDPYVIEKFNKKGILYIRNYTNGLGVNWRDVFQTSKREEVEKYCFENSIQYEWQAKDPVLKTRQTCPAEYVHPLTQEKVWFNQAHLFHESNVPTNIRDLLLLELGRKNLPRNAYYGDGEEIESPALEHIREVYDKMAITFQWQKGDVMILDNVLMAHGRKPYTGNRKIAVAMA